MNEPKVTPSDPNKDNPREITPPKKSPEVPLKHPNEIPRERPEKAPVEKPAKNS